MHSSEITPHILRRYRFVRELGAGGMGRVLLVEDLEQENALRALKWVNGKADSAEEKRLLREYRLLSKFHHPHILRVHRFYRAPHGMGQYYTADYLAGPSLSELIRAGKLTFSRGYRAFVQLLRALEFLHE